MHFFCWSIYHNEVLKDCLDWQKVGSNIKKTAVNTPKIIAGIFRIYIELVRLVEVKLRKFFGGKRIKRKYIN
jgi:hypothetical protein